MQDSTRLPCGTASSPEKTVRSWPSRDGPDERWGRGNHWHGTQSNCFGRWSTAFLHYADGIRCMQPTRACRSTGIACDGELGTPPCRSIVWTNDSCRTASSIATDADPRGTSCIRASRAAPHDDNHCKRPAGAFRSMESRFENGRSLPPSCLLPCSIRLACGNWRSRGLR